MNKYVALALFLVLAWLHFTFFTYIVIRIFQKLIPINRRSVWLLFPLMFVIHVALAYGILVIMSYEYVFMFGGTAMYDVEFLILQIIGLIFSVAATRRLKI